MRYFLGMICLLLPGALCVQGQEEAKKAVEIIYHGHSFYEIVSSKGTVIVLDPHWIEAYGRPLNVKADAVCMSHSHPDHTQVKVLENPEKVKQFPGLKGEGFRADWNIVNEKIKDVTIRSVGLYHDNAEGMKYGKNTAFIIEVDGWKIAHLGDVGHVLSDRQLKEIGKVDVLMLPVGGIYTINGSEAQKVVKQVKPKEYIFPMHYGTPIFDEVLDEEEFVEYYPDRQIAKMDTNRIRLNRDPNRPRPLVVLPHYWPKKN